MIFVSAQAGWEMKVVNSSSCLRTMSDRHARLVDLASHLLKYVKRLING